MATTFATARSMPVPSRTGGDGGSAGRAPPFQSESPNATDRTASKAMVLPAETPGCSRVGSTPGCRDSPDWSFRGRFLRVNWPGRIRRLSFSFGNNHDSVRGCPGEEFLAAIRPDDLQRIDTVNRAQAEVDAGIVAAEVAGAGVEVLTRPASRPHGDLGAIGVAAQDRIEGPNHQPVAAPGVTLRKTRAGPASADVTTRSRAPSPSMSPHARPRRPASHWRTEG